MENYKYMHKLIMIAENRHNNYLPYLYQLINILHLFVLIYIYTI